MEGTLGRCPPDSPNRLGGAAPSNPRHQGSCASRTAAPWGAAPSNPLHLGCCAPNPCTWGCAPKRLQWLRSLITLLHP